jgi:hypothetical protein
MMLNFITLVSGLYVAVAVSIEALAVAGALPAHMTGIIRGSLWLPAIPIIVGCAAIAYALWNRGLNLAQTRSALLLAVSLLAVSAYLFGAIKFFSLANILLAISSILTLFYGLRRRLTEDNLAAADQLKPRYSVVLLALILTLASFIFLFRLTEIPLLPDTFGVHIISRAQKFLNGEVSLYPLILMHEMTQEECVLSPLYVLWNSIFQLLCGGPSLLSARLGSAIAALISIVLTFRIGSKLVSPTFGLWGCFIYSIMPITQVNARNEAIFGFSIMLCLIVIYAAISFIRDPTKTRAFILGIAIPVSVYGIANIRVMSAACIVMLADYAWSHRRSRNVILNLLLASVIAGIILSPQIMDWDTVRGQLRGRGEHLFGGSGKSLLRNNPDSSPFLIIGNLIWSNANFLWDFTFRHPGHIRNNFSGVVSVFTLLGAILCLSRLNSPICRFMLFFGACSLFAPLIAIPLSAIRCRLLVISQALFAAYYLHEINMVLRLAIDRIPRLIFTFCLIVSVSIFGIISSWTSLADPSPTAELRSRLESLPSGTVIFVSSPSEADFAYFRWNPPRYRDNASDQVPIIGIPDTAIPEALNLIEQHAIQAVVVFPKRLEGLKSNRNLWRFEAIYEYLLSSPDPDKIKILPVEAQNIRWREHIPRSNHSNPQERRAVYGSDPFETQVVGNEATLHFSNRSSNRDVIIIPRMGSGFSPPASLSIDQGSVALDQLGSLPDSKNVGFTWYYAKEISRGEHQITLTKINGVEDWYLDGAIIIKPAAQDVIK